MIIRISEHMDIQSYMNEIKIFVSFLWIPNSTTREMISDIFLPHYPFFTNIISCLIDRAFKICSTELAFTLELKFLKQFFLCNNFPINFIDKCFKKTIKFIYNGKTSYATVPKKPINIKLPFLGPQTYIAKRKLSALITKFYPHVSIRFIITPSLNIQNFFSFKDKLPISIVSSVIYQYSCGQCSATCIGETRKQLKVRVSQHKGISIRTGNMLNSVEKSKILDHSLNSGHCTTENNFKILDSCQPFDLRILESTRLPVTRWVKLSLNFEFLVPK